VEQFLGYQSIKEQYMNVGFEQTIFLFGARPLCLRRGPKPDNVFDPARREHGLEWMGLAAIHNVRICGLMEEK
jgi:hypothetical protein